VAAQYIVASYSADLPKYTSCIVAEEEDSPIPATHSQVFGPASKQHCERWVQDNCSPREAEEG
jgi:hypothetical protein